MINLEEGRRLLAKATRGPWEHRAPTADDGAVWEGVYDAEGLNVEDSTDDCLLIVWLRNNAEALLAMASKP